MVNRNSHPELITYLRDLKDGEKVPPLNTLSSRLGISVSRLREQLEVAKALGFVAVRPRVGIRQLEYSFTPAVRSSLDYAIQLDHRHFEEYLDLRRHLENAYLVQAGQALKPEDHGELEELIGQAWEKLHGRPVRIPHEEHRQFHLMIYRRLDNPFVTGLIEAYWDAYETVGLNVYADLAYLEEVWNYHERIAGALAAGEYKLAKRLLQEHFDLLMDRLAS